jgi:cytochrome c1
MAKLQLNKELADEQVADLVCYLKSLTDKNSKQRLRQQP